MVVADGAGDLPDAVLVLPEGYELCFAHVVGVVGMVEAVDADFDGAVSVERIDLKCAGDEGALDLTADVLLDGGEEGGLAGGESGLIVIELEVVCHHRSQGGEIAVVVGIEEFGIERLDGFEEGVGLGWRWGCGLGVAGHAEKSAEDGQG